MITNVQRVIDHCDSATFSIGEYDEMSKTEDLRNALVDYKMGNTEIISRLCDYGCPSSHGIDEAADLCDDTAWHKYHQEERPKQNWKTGFPVCEECWKRALDIEV